MKRLGEVVRKHKLLFKPFFQDKDIAKIGRVSFTRMRSILDNNKIPLTEYQYQLLCKHFSYEDKEFNYVDFIESLKKYEL
jgi:Ca2+-binding EF-hand superfamily protein